MSMSYESFVRAREIASQRWKPKYPYYKPGDPCLVCGELCDDSSDYIDGIQVTYLMHCLNCGAEGGNAGANVYWYVWDERWGGYRSIDRPRPQQLAMVFDPPAPPEAFPLF